MQNLKKYDGKQDPRQWLRIYSTAIEVAGGTNSTKVIYFPMALESAPLTWLESLRHDSIHSWEDLKKIIIDNIQGSIHRLAVSAAPVQTDRPSPWPSSPPSPQPPPSPLSPPAQRATSTPTPPAPKKGKKKTASLPAAGPTKKKQKTIERKLTYEKTAEELEEETAQYIKE